MFRGLIEDIKASA
jgi:hypothetical protein